MENLVIQVLDIKTAFLHGKLDEEIYIMQPEGFAIKGQESKVYKLEQTLYGLKQASLTWNKEAHKSLLEHGLSCTTNHLLSINHWITVMVNFGQTS